MTKRQEKSSERRLSEVGSPMTDLDELEAATREAARDDLDDSDSFSACEVFQQLAIPSVVLELILEVRRLRAPSTEEKVHGL